MNVLRRPFLDSPMSIGEALAVLAVSPAFAIAYTLMLTVLP
jgi:hypothetical protein